MKLLQHPNSNLLCSRTWGVILWFINTNDSEEHIASVCSGEEAKIEAAGSTERYPSITQCGIAYTGTYSKFSGVHFG